MSYRELLARYRAGELDPQQEAAVREDIEKQDAISEYLCEEGEIPELGDIGEGFLGEEAGQDTAAEIHRAIHRAFVKAGIVVGAVVLAVVLFVIFALPRVVDMFYYDPTEETDWRYVMRSRGDVALDIPLNRIQADMGIFSDLFIPCRYEHMGTLGNDISAVSEGWGCYSVNIPRDYQHQMYSDFVWGRIRRGQMTLSDPNYYQLPWADFFLPREGEERRRKTAFYDVDAKTPEQLDPQRIYTCYVTLKEPYPVSQLYETFLPKHGGSSILYGNSVWVEAWVEDEAGEVLSRSVGIHLPDKHFENVQYPHAIAGMSRVEDEAVSKLFADTLRYARDCPEFGLMFFREGSMARRLLEDPERMDRIIASVEEEGLMVKRFVVRARGTMVQNYDEDERVDGVEVLP